MSEHRPALAPRRRAGRESRDTATGDGGGQGPRIPGYRSFQLIGQGGQSIVYTAYQERLDRTVAVKVIGADLTDAAAERRFTRECKAVGKLTGHPNIITVFDAGSTQDRRPFITMQYLPAGSLADRVKRDGPLGVAEVLRTGAQIAEALQAAHDAKILHRDLKPGNILISDRGEPVVSDFGIASRGLGTDMSFSSGILTPAFAAPEILRGGTATFASDLYGLGATLFAMLTGEPPFGHSPEDNAISVTLRILTEYVRPIQRTDVPAEVENELRRLLSREPSDRPRSAAATAAELRRLDALLGHTHRRTPPTPIGTPARITPSARDVSLGDRAAGPVSEVGLDQRAASRRASPSAPPHPAATEPPSPRSYPPTQEQRRIRRLMAAVIALGLIITIFTAAAIFAPGAENPATEGENPGAAAATSPSAGAAAISSAPPPTITPEDVAAARPRRLTVAESGTTANLTWENGSASTNLAVQLSDAAGLGAFQTLPDGATEYEATGLDPTQGYCFRVGAILGSDPATGAIAAWSAYACIRGALPPA